MVPILDLAVDEVGRHGAGLKPFKEGAAYIAIKAGVPVIPLCLKGTLEVLPMGSLNVRPGRVLLRVGDPVSTIGLTLRDREQLSDELFQRVAELLGEPSYTQTK